MTKIFGGFLFVSALATGIYSLDIASLEVVHEMAPTPSEEVHASRPDISAEERQRYLAVGGSFILLAGGLYFMLKQPESERDICATTAPVDLGDGLDNAINGLNLSQVTLASAAETFTALSA